MMRRYWGGKEPEWAREIAGERRWLSSPVKQRHARAEVTPATGDIVIKPFIDMSTYKQLFRVETWDTHALLDGPFDSVREAVDAAFEFGVTARLVVWLDYSDDPQSHDLDTVPLYCCDKADADQSSVA